MKNTGIKHYDLVVDGHESTLFIVIYSSEIIGSCMLFLDGWIQDFHIAENSRGAGIGTELFKSVKKVAEDKNIKILEGLVDPKNKALGFWNKNGFLSVLEDRGYWITKNI